MKKSMIRAVKIFKKILQKLREDNISEYSAYSALFIILSFLPFSMLLLGIVGSLGLSKNIEFSDLYVLSDDITRFIKSLLKEAERNKTSLISFGTAAALWSSARGLTGIMNGLDRIHNDSARHGHIITRIKAALYTVIFASVMIATLVILVFGQLITEKLATLLPENAAMLNAPFLRTAVSFAVLTVFFIFIFTVVPNAKGKISEKLPGAVFSAAGWLIFSAVYSFYVRNFAANSVFYGSLAVIIMLILWLYFCMYILFLGEELNTRLHTSAKRKKQ